MNNPHIGDTSHILNTHPALKLDGAVALWRKNRGSVAKAAEIAGLTVPELKEALAAQGIRRETEGKSRAENCTRPFRDGHYSRHGYLSTLSR
jgi:predicted HTH domain antitoxin